MDNRLILKELDLKLLYFKYDEEQGRMITDNKTTQYKRLLANNVVDEECRLTDKGRAMRGKLLKQMEKLNWGIPFDKRPKDPIMSLRLISGFWFSLIVGQQVVLLDPSRSFLIATTTQEVRQRRVGNYKRKWLTSSIERMRIDFLENSVECHPEIFQRTPDWNNFIWMKAGEQWVCIQARFYEMMNNAYKGARFYTTKEGYAVFVSVKRRIGFDGMFAVIMTMEGMECQALKTGRWYGEEKALSDN